METTVKTTIKKDSEWGVYIVRTYVNGVYQAGCDVEADTRKEAQEIADEIKADIEKRISDGRYNHVNDLTQEHILEEFIREEYGSDYDKEINKDVIHTFKSTEERDTVIAYIDENIDTDYEIEEDEEGGCVTIFDMTVGDFLNYKKWLITKNYV